jgi:hypothetical protein
MVNGKQGDHPLTDILHYGIPTFTPEIDGLVRELYELGGLHDEESSRYLLYVGGDLARLRRQGVETEEPEVVQELKVWLLEQRARLLEE